MAISLFTVCMLVGPACDPAVRTADRSGAGAADPSSGGDGCTLTQGYWKNHHAGAKKSQQVPWPIPEDTPMCGQGWLEILKTPPKGDEWYILAHQWIAASLNAASGAEVPPEVADALGQGEVLLADCEISADEHAAALAAAALLDGFNNGELGPGHCGDDDETGGDTADTGEATSDTFDSGWPIPG